MYSTPTKGEPKEVPLKNWASHVGDGFSYGCQYYYHDDERTAKRKLLGELPVFRNSYTVR